MKIKDYTISGPNSEGVLKHQFELCIKNPTAETIRQVRYHTILLNDSNSPVGSLEHAFMKEIIKDVRLDPDDSVTFRVHGFPRAYEMADVMKRKLLVHIRLMTREHVDLGVHKVPATDCQPVYGSTTTNSRFLQGDIAYTIAQVCYPEETEDDEPAPEERCSIDTLVAVNNNSPTHFEKSRLYYQFIDDEGVAIDEGYQVEQDIQPKQFTFIEHISDTLYSPRWKDVSLKFGITLYAEAFSLTLEATSESVPLDEDDDGEDW